MINYSEPLVMGIINLSNDSFYSESRCTTDEQFTSKFEQMLKEGADIIDLGACSTRPGQKSISSDEEWELLKPALKRVLRDYPSSEISIDTFRAEIVERSYDFVGDFMVNDISAGEDDKEMLETVARLELPYIAMHKKGTPETMQALCQYKNVVEEIREYFLDFLPKAEATGIKKIIIDPGFGFAKNIDQNYEILTGLNKLKINSGTDGGFYSILVGISRKSMIYRFLDISPEDALAATTAIHLQALINGADILRVHDVKEAKQIVKIFRKISVKSV
ncbi:MAG: dihydropteroate synthase [Bacteroidetes bacterium GWF2_40_14]|nr:MAG: dihydropteroate synthase [Bacteroidetes bacterium GWF2_40_14]